MCDIDKNLSNHIVRHSFGNIAGDNIHPLMLQKLYRYNDLKTTINYQANFIHKEADEALETHKAQRIPTFKLVSTSPLT